jgi:tape measure domain-containing protein
MVDTMAATGGGVEQLDGLVMALGQSWSKGKLQSEEALQLLERGVPVWELLATKMGRPAEEIQAMATAGKLGREEITLLMEALGEKNAGASDGMSKTWDGVISNLMDYWTRFQLMVMDSGVFDSLKAKLQAFLDLLNQMAADGRLQAFADILATKMLAAIEGLWSFGKGMVAIWQEVFPWLEAGANAMGGWENFMMIVAAGAFVGKLIAIGKSVILVAKGLMLIGRGTLMAMPIIGLIAGIALAAYTIYQNWDAIAAFFTNLWGQVTAAFSAAWNWIKSTVVQMTPAPIKAAWSILTAYFSGLWDAVKQVFQRFVTFVTGLFTGDMTRAGDGLKMIWDGVKTGLKAAFDAIGSALRLVWETVIKPITDKLGLTDAIVAGWNALKASFDVVLNAIGSLFSTIWANSVQPLIDGLASVGGVAGIWEGMKEAMASVMDWLGAKFDWLWQKISPVIDALRWVRDKGAAALETLGLTGDGGDAGVSAYQPGEVDAFAKGGNFGKGPIIVGENGPELRYESRGGFIAHNRALTRMASLARAAATGGGAGANPLAGLADLRPAGGAVSFQPSYALTLNVDPGNGSPDQIEAVVNRALAAHEARLRADARRFLND